MLRSEGGTLLRQRKSSSLSSHSTESLSGRKESPRYADGITSRTGPHCNGPLPRADSSALSLGLLTRSSLFGDGPVLTGALTFRSVSRYPDGMETTKQQTRDIYFIKQLETRIDDD
ncbi:hypothetical protein T09_7918, partial [Trichinella sp. T9]